MSFCFPDTNCGCHGYGQRVRAGVRSGTAPAAFTLITRIRDSPASHEGGRKVSVADGDIICVVPPFLSNTNWVASRPLTSSTAVTTMLFISIDSCATIGVTASQFWSRPLYMHHPFWNEPDFAVTLIKLLVASPASAADLATCSAARNSLVCVDTRLFSITILKLGTAIPSNTARTATVIISSIRVKPLDDCMMRLRFSSWALCLPFSQNTSTTGRVAGTTR